MKKIWIFEFFFEVCSTKLRSLVSSLRYLVSNGRQVLLRGIRLGGSATHTLCYSRIQFLPELPEQPSAPVSCESMTFFLKKHQTLDWWKERMIEKRMLRPTTPSTSWSCPLAGRPHLAEPGRGAVAVAGLMLRSAHGVAEATRPLWPASSVAEAAAPGAQATGQPSQARSEGLWGHVLGSGTG